MTLTIEYELTESDFVEFNVQHHLLSASSRKRRLVSKWIIAVLYALIGLYFLKDYQFIWSAVIGLVFITFAIGWFAFYDRYYYHRIRRNSYKLLREGSNAGMLGKQSLVLSDKSIKTTDANGEAEYKGPFIKKVTENTRYLYCYISSVAAIIIPKTTFSSEETIREFKEGIIKFVVT